MIFLPTGGYAAFAVKRAALVLPGQGPPEAKKKQRHQEKTKPTQQNSPKSLSRCPPTKSHAHHPSHAPTKGSKPTDPSGGQHRSGTSGRKPTDPFTRKVWPQELRLVGKYPPTLQTTRTKKPSSCPPTKSHAHPPSHPPAKGSKPTDPPGGQQGSGASGRKPTAPIKPINRPQELRLVGKDPPTLQAPTTQKKSRPHRGKRLFRINQDRSDNTQTLTPI